MAVWLQGVPWARLLLYGTALWVATGVLGTTLSAVRGETQRVRHGWRAVGLVVAVYFAVLLGVSLASPPRQVQLGHSRCFDGVCLSVAGVEELPGFQARGQERARLVRVSVLVHNTRLDRAAAEPGLEAYLLDAAGRRWNVVPGLGGVSLGTRLEPGRTVTSDPIFRVGRDAAGLKMVIAHRGWSWRRLVVGDAESLLHPPAEMLLD